MCAVFDLFISHPPSFSCPHLLEDSCGQVSCGQMVGGVEGSWEEIKAKRNKATSCRGRLVKRGRRRRTGDGGWSQLLQDAGQVDGGRRRLGIKEVAANLK